MYSIREVSEYLGITPQAIYKRSPELREKGYMLKERNGMIITAEGLNYLQDEQVQRARIGQAPVKQQDQKQIDEEQLKQDKEESTPVENLFENLNNRSKVSNAELEHIKVMYNTIIDFYKKQNEILTQEVNKLQKDVEYFKQKFEEKDKLYTEIANQKLLGVAEENKSIWHKIFRK